MRTKIIFILASLTTSLIAVLINALPYFLTRHAYQHDGQEIAGFPFAFHKICGDCTPLACDTYNFDLGYFAADLIILFSCAIVVGIVVVKIKNRQKPR